VITVATIMLAAQIRWRASLLGMLVQELKEALAEAKGKAEEVSEDLLVFDGLTRKYVIPAVYWKLVLAARIFSVRSLFSLCEHLCHAEEASAWLDWLGVSHVGELLRLPELTIPNERFRCQVTAKVYGVLSKGTKSVSVQDVRQLTKEFYGLPGKYPKNAIRPAKYLEKQYAKAVRKKGLSVGEFMAQIFQSRDRLVSQGGGYWQKMPKLTARELREYRRNLGEDNPLDEELSRISEHVSFDFVAPILRDRYREFGRPANHPVFMWKIVFLGWYFNIRTPAQLESEIRNNMAYKKFVGLPLNARPPERTTIYWFMLTRLMPHVDEIFHLLVHRCKEAGLLSGRLAGDGFCVVGQERKKSDARLRNLEEFRRWVQEYLYTHLQEEGRKELTEEDVKSLLAAAENLDTTGFEGLSKQLREAVHETITELLEESGIDVGALLSRRESERPEEQREGSGEGLSPFERELFDEMSEFLRQHYKEGYSLQVAHDPEGGPRKKYELTTHGFGAQLLVDAKSRCIVDIRVFPNNQRFRKHFAAQVLDVKARYEYGKVVVSADSEFTRSSVIHDLSGAEGVEFYGPLAPRQNQYKKRGLFGAEAFELEEHEGQRYLRCPGGELLSRVQGPCEDGGSMLETFKGKPRQCESCESSGQCRGGKGPRTVKRDLYLEEVQAHRAQMGSPEAKVIMGVHRAAAEGMVGELKKHRLLERAREKGVARMMYRAYMAAIISNTKRLVRALEEQRTSAAAA